MEILSFGNTGWGDELFFATLMTVAVSVTAMLIGFLFSTDKFIIAWVDELDIKSK